MEVVMLEQYFLRPTTVDQIRSNWLAPQIEQYVEWMHAQKYARQNITRRIALLCHFADFARTNGVTDLASANSLVEKFGDHWMADNRCWNLETRPKLRRDMCSIIRQMLRLIVDGRVTRERGHPPFQFQSDAPGFFKYLLEERGMTKLTVARYVRELNRLADFLKRVGVTSLRDLSPQLLSSFVIETAPKFAPNTRRDLCGVIRTFLRYLHRERILDEDLSVTFEIPKLFRLSNVPRSITWGEMRKVLEVVDRRTVRGRRDYAILLMLVTYGLRACEVANLTLDDIDWRHERLQIPNRKAGNCTAYPLAGVVADALIDYLKNARPETSERRLFLRVVAPAGPFGNGGVAASVALYLQKAGIKVHRAGSHTLRHTCVQRLIDAEFPLKTIGDYVGHRRSQSTEVYAKVAIETLREVAIGDGEAL
jgi:site-specific recombinase XerD